MAHSSAWLSTPDGSPRGYIVAQELRELWFHMGTRCNLSCSFCLEGSSPNDKRLATPKFVDVKPYIDEALTLGVEQFSFTGGEPFLAKDMVDILDYASRHRPCLVLTNGSDPLFKRLPALAKLINNPHPISLRLSIDHADAALHDAERGVGNFAKVLTGLKRLYELGFSVSVARHMQADEDTQSVEQQYQDLFALNGLPRDLKIVAFPDFLTPGSLPQVPHISEHCMTTYQSEESRRQFMCAFSKMIVKSAEGLGVFACTLVDDDDEYNLGTDLSATLDRKISMKHHRCYSCFAFGSSCSEI